MVSRKRNRMRIHDEKTNTISFILLVCLVAVHSQEEITSTMANKTSSPGPVTTNIIALKRYRQGIPVVSKEIVLDVSL